MPDLPDLAGPRDAVSLVVRVNELRRWLARAAGTRDSGARDFFLLQSR